MASKCGYTASGYALLSKIAEMKDKGVEVAIFPCNQFGAQEVLYFITIIRTGKEIILLFIKWTDDVSIVCDSIIKCFISQDLMSRLHHSVH